MATGESPPAPPEQPLAFGEWMRGWQFYASDALENKAYENVLQQLGGGCHAHTNAVTAGKTRVQSSRGPYAAIWLTICPTTANLVLDN
eukprot:2607504-Pyramimonas_sp.AAC.1